jgi:hypothetical protein
VRITPGGGHIERYDFTRYDPITPNQILAAGGSGAGQCWEG